MKKLKRDRLKIYGDLLSILDEEAEKEKIVLSWVQVRLNVPFDRLKKYLGELIDLEMVDDEKSLKVTEKGRVFVREYKKVLDFLEDMGLGYQ
jgi:predicted transcriptional regulator